MEKLLHLVMIVKNGGNDIVNMLEKNKKYIDHWTILDTGSIDGTQSRILDLMKDVPGELYEEPFVDFEYSRNRSLELAGDKCEWIIVLDDTYEIMNGDALRVYLNQECNKINSLTLTIEDKINKYPSTRIIRSKCGYRYKYRVHEMIIAPGSAALDYNISYLIDNTSDYMKKRSEERYSKDYEILKEDFEKNPTDGRLCFYLAKTCLKIDREDEGIALLNRRLLMSGESGEIYESYIILTNNKLSKNTLTEKDVLELYKKYPNYEDSVRNVIGFYYKKKDYIKAFDYVNNFFRKKEGNLLYHSIKKSTYFDIMYMYVDLCFLTSNIEMGIQILKIILNEYPTNIRFRNIKNCIVNPVKESIRLEGKVFAIHSGGENFPEWDPESHNQHMSGSEYMTINISEKMAELGFRCFVFGNFNFERKIYKNVEYINYEFFIDFADDYIIDYLIISRTSENIYYGYGVQNIFLWVHDILSNAETGSFILNQIHKDKFKKVLALCNWHKDRLKKEGIPSDKIYVTRNSISIERFIRYTPPKQKNRFIYSSSPNRGLTKLLYFFQKIINRYEDSELYIFCDNSQLDIEQSNLIQITKGVTLNNRISQDQIAIEYLKSDIWFYPTDFKETYCITALESQISKVLCFTSNIGSLSEIVGNRGVTYSPSLSDDKILEKLFFVLDNQSLKNKLVEKAYNWALKQDTHNLALEWIQFLG